MKYLLFLGGASKASASMVSFVEMSSLVENKYGRTEHSQHYQFKWLSSTPARSQELGSRQPKVYLPFLFSVLAGRGMYEWQDLHLETVAPRLAQLRGGGTISNSVTPVCGFSSSLTLC